VPPPLRHPHPPTMGTPPPLRHPQPPAMGAPPPLRHPLHRRPPSPRLPPLARARRWLARGSIGGVNGMWWIAGCGGCVSWMTKWIREGAVGRWI
jgi:hypothetical protein